MRLVIFFIAPMMLLWCGCATSKVNGSGIEGTYTQMGDSILKSNINLIIGANSFALVDRDYNKIQHSGNVLLCCDTITYGAWRFDKKRNLLRFSTPELFEDYLPVTVLEKTSRSPDSVYFLIESPIESQLGPKNEDLSYIFELTSSNDRLMFDLSDKEFSSNEIGEPNVAHGKLIDLALFIYAKPQLYPRLRHIAVNPIKTLPYKVQNAQANTFIIKIPALTLKAFTFLRLHNHILDVISHNEIIWDNVKYIRIE